MEKRNPAHDDEIRKKNGLLERAMYEIRHLRRENELMSARLQVFDTLTSFLRARTPDGGMVLGEDLAYSIERHLQSDKDRELKREETAAPANYDGYETGD
jgi:hypothetical protein